MNIRCALPIALGLLLCSFSACSKRASVHPQQANLEELRQRVRANDDASSAKDAQVEALWLLAELLEPGGDPARVRLARKRLDAGLTNGLYQDLARGLDDAVHGNLGTASDHFLRAASAARHAAPGASR